MSMPISMKAYEEPVGRRLAIVSAVLGLHLAASVLLSLESKVEQRSNETAISVTFIEMASEVPERHTVVEPAAVRSIHDEALSVEAPSSVERTPPVKRAIPRSEKKAVPIKAEAEPQAQSVEAEPSMLESAPTASVTPGEGNSQPTGAMPNEPEVATTSMSVASANDGDGEGANPGLRASGQEIADTPAVFDAAYLNNPKPVYSRKARLLRHEGLVKLRVLVSTLGAAQEVLVRTSSGSSFLDDSAVDTVKKWKFTPAHRGDSPVESWVVVPINFKLDY